jgi:hypothetical protein
LDKSPDPSVLKNLIYAKGLTPHRLALNLRIEPSNFSRFISGKPGMISEENLARVCEAIGYDPNTHSLKSGIHRFTAKSMTLEDMDRIETTVRSLIPGGVTAIPLKPEGFFEGLTRYVYVLIPHLERNIRVVLSVKAISSKSFFSDERGLRLGGLGSGSKWRGGAVSDQCPLDSVLVLPKPVIERIVVDESLSVESLDQILGIERDSADWTWEMVIAGMEKKGIIPREAAKILGLL